MFYLIDVVIVCVIGMIYKLMEICFFLYSYDENIFVWDIRDIR